MRRFWDWVTGTTPGSRPGPGLFTRATHIGQHRYA